MPPYKLSITFQVEDQQFIDALDHIAAQQGRTRSGLIKFILNQYIDEEMGDE